MGNKKIKVIIKNPCDDMKEALVEDELKTYQKLVNGHIETICFPNDDKITFVANEEAKLKDLLPNIYLPHYKDILLRTLVAVSVNDDGEFESLTEKQIKKVKHYIETFKLDKYIFASEDYIQDAMSKQIKKYEQEEDLC